MAWRMEEDTGMWPWHEWGASVRTRRLSVGGSWRDGWELDHRAKLEPILRRLGPINVVSR